VALEIDLLNGSSIRDRDLRDTARLLEDIFAARVSLQRVALDLARAYDVTRKQVNSTALLSQILEAGVDPGHKRLAIVDVDLFIPVLTFVFGEAQLSGKAAVVSTHRISNQFYGLPRNDALMRERLGKEIVHELGHTFGLFHCRQYDCVMRASTYVEEIDLKRSYPCESCAGLIRAHQATSLEHAPGMRDPRPA
jgi:archaemetzincin